MKPNEINTYLPKFIPVQAVQWDGTNIEEIRKLTRSAQMVVDRLIVGTKIVNVGDYIVSNQQSEVFVQSEDDFLDEYDTAEEKMEIIRMAIPGIGNSWICDECYKRITEKWGKEIEVLTITNFLLCPCAICEKPGEQNFHLASVTISKA